MLRQQKFLTKLISQLSDSDENKHQETLEEIESVRKILTSEESLTLFIATNVDKLTSQVSDVYSCYNELPVGKNSVHKPK